MKDSVISSHFKGGENEPYDEIHLVTEWGKQFRGLDYKDYVYTF